MLDQEIFFEGYGERIIDDVRKKTHLQTKGREDGALISLFPHVLSSHLSLFEKSILSILFFTLFAHLARIVH